MMTLKQECELTGGYEQGTKVRTLWINGETSYTEQ